MKTKLLVLTVFLVPALCLSPVASRKARTEPVRISEKASTGNTETIAQLPVPSEIEKVLNDGKWIERANLNQLSESERLQLANLLDRYHAAVIAEWERTDAQL